MKTTEVIIYTYKQMTEAYDKKDAALAVGLYLCIWLFYLGAGYLQMTFSSNVPAIIINFLLIAIVLAMVHIRAQKLSTVGFTLHAFKRSLVVGAVIGLIIAVGATIIPALLSGGRWVGLASTLWYFFYMLTNIAFVEELLFRGYIQTRLYGVIKSDIAAVILGGVLFMGMHIPFQLFNRSSGDIVDFLSTNALWLFTTFIMHLVLNLLYRKYNSLTAPTICHFIINFGSTLFG